MRILATLFFMVCTVFVTTVLVGQNLEAAVSTVLSMGFIWFLTWVYALVPTYLNNRMSIREHVISTSSTVELSTSLLPEINQKGAPKVSAQIASSIIGMIMLCYFLVTILPTQFGSQVTLIEISEAGYALCVVFATIVFCGFVLSIVLLPITFIKNFTKPHKSLRALTQAINVGFGSCSLYLIIVWYTMCSRAVGDAFFSYHMHDWTVYRSFESIGAFIVLSLISTLIWDFYFEGEVLQLKELKVKYLDH